jgi:Flp pilus assembly pilin Flp
MNHPEARDLSTVLGFLSFHQEARKRGGMQQLIGSISKHQGGEVAIEYAFIIALVSIAAVVAFEALGISVFSIFGTISSGLSESIGSQGGS